MYTFQMCAPFGVYGRKATNLCHGIAQLSFGERVSFTKMSENRTAKVTSLLGLLSLGLSEGEEFTIIIDEGNTHKEQEVKRVFAEVSCA